MRIPLVLHPTLTDRTKPSQGWRGVGRGGARSQKLPNSGGLGARGRLRGMRGISARSTPVPAHPRAARTAPVSSPSVALQRARRSLGRAPAGRTRAIHPGRTKRPIPGHARSKPAPRCTRFAHGNRGTWERAPSLQLRPGARRAPRTSALLLGARGQWHKFGVPGTELALLGRPCGERSRRAPRC